MHALVRRGGGIGLFTGCAAGDTGAARACSRSRDALSRRPTPRSAAGASGRPRPGRCS